MKRYQLVKSKLDETIETKDETNFIEDPMAEFGGVDLRKDGTSDKDMFEFIQKGSPEFVEDSLRGSIQIIDSAPEKKIKKAETIQEEIAQKVEEVEFLTFEKAGGHKYIRKIGTGPNARYIYNNKSHHYSGSRKVDIKGKIKEMHEYHDPESGVSVLSETSPEKAPEAKLNREDEKKAHDKLVAETILQQMGGQHRITTMTGAKNFFIIDNGVQFDLNRKKYLIKLNGKDLYDIEIGRFDSKKLEYKKLDTVKDVYNENLKATMEEVTGYRFDLF